MHFESRTLRTTPSRYSRRRFRRFFFHPRSGSCTPPRTLSTARHQARDPVQSRQHHSSGSISAPLLSARPGQTPLATRFVIRMPQQTSDHESIMTGGVRQSQQSHACSARSDTIRPHLTFDNHGCQASGPPCHSHDFTLVCVYAIIR